MTKKLFFSFCLLFTAAIFNFYGQNAPASSSASNTTDPGVVINGVKWATRNVDKPGTFAAKPEEAGMFYQWNRRIGWFAYGDDPVNSNSGTSWDNSTPSGTSWTYANDPSPAGWRVPALAEITALLDKNKVRYEWTSVNRIYGGNFTDLTTGNSIFLPAVGYRDDDDGTLYHVGAYGGYWSSTQSGSDHAYVLNFNSDNADWGNDGNRRDGFSVRPVAE